MIVRHCLKVTLICVVCAGLAACGARSKSGGAQTGDAQPQGSSSSRVETVVNFDPITNNRESMGKSDKSSIWDIFGASKTEQTVNVNRYLWAASLDVLSFLPVQSVDPFTGVIVTGYGTPPGGGRAYRATVHINDPSLDARSLNVSLQTQGGQAVNASTARAVEDAILTRARQLRVRDRGL